jgi:hypothetical protein
MMKLAEPPPSDDAIFFEGGRRQRVTYLEESALSALFGRGTQAAPRDLLRLRRRLVSPFFESRPLIIGSQWVFLEMSCGVNSGKVAQQNDLEVNFLWMLRCGNVVASLVRLDAGIPETASIGTDAFIRRLPSGSRGAQHGNPE